MIQYRYRGVSAGGSLVYWQTTSPDPTGASAPEAVTNVVQLNMPFVQLSDTSTGKTWHTLLDTDFTAQATVSSFSDGAVTIGGQTWTVANMANAYAGRTMGILNGSGLRTCRDNGSQQWYYHEWPLIRWQLPPQVVNGVPLRVAVQGGGADTDYSWRGSMVALAYPSAATYSRYCIGTARTTRGDVPQLQVTAEMRAEGGQHAPASQPTVWGTTGMMPDWTFDLYGLDFPEGVGYGTRTYSTWGQSTAGHRTDLGKMSKFAWFPIIPPVNVYGSVSQANPAMFQAENWCVCLMGSDNGTPQDYVRSIKVEAYY